MIQTVSFDIKIRSRIRYFEFFALTKNRTQYFKIYQSETRLMGYSMTTIVFQKIHSIEEISCKLQNCLLKKIIIIIIKL